MTDKNETTNENTQDLQKRIDALEREKQLLAEKIAGEGFDNKEIEDIQIIVKEKEKPVPIPLGRGGKLTVPSFIINGAGVKFMIRVANTDPAKLRGWLMEGYVKCTYKEIGITDKDIFPDDPARGRKGAPNGVARIGEDMIVLKIPETLWKQRMQDKDFRKKSQLQGILHSSAEGINRDAREKYHVKKDIAIGPSLDHKKIEDM